MTEVDLLTKVKTRLGITGDYHDELLTAYIEDVKYYLRDAGVSDDVLESDASVGVISRGVSDSWNYGSGDGTFSEIFYQRVAQLRHVVIKERDKVVKLSPYLYKTKYDVLDYEAGAAFFEKYRPTIGACSAVSKGNLFGRNYDWTYDERCSFVIQTEAKNGRHATLGVAVAPSNLTKEVIDSGAPSDDYKIVPFMLMDGINDAGLICEINVAPTGDKGLTFGTNTDGEDLFAMMIPRYVLDYAETVDEAITLLQSRNIFCAYSDALKQEFHFMLADGTKTAVIEFVNNEMIVIEQFVNDKPIMTNFYLDGYDGSRESLTPYAMGIERQAILTDGYAAATSENAMFNLMRSVLYTGTYEEHESGSPFWYSEFVGNWEKYGDLTKDSPPEDFERIISDYREIFAKRKRDGKTWQTVHTSVYNIEKRKLIMSPQETVLRFAFALPTESGGADDGTE